MNLADTSNSSDVNEEPPDRILYGSFIKRQSISVPQLWPHINDPTAPQLLRQFSVDSVCEGVVGQEDELLFDGTLSVQDNEDNATSETSKELTPITKNEDNETAKFDNPKPSTRILPPRHSKRVRRVYNN